MTNHLIIGKPNRIGNLVVLQNYQHMRRLQSNNVGLPFFHIKLYYGIHATFIKIGLQQRHGCPLNQTHKVL
jgi:hypothetical protein